MEPAFVPNCIYRSVFKGEVYLPAFFGTLLLPGDVSFQTGIYDSLVHNSIIENALVYKVAMLSNALVRRGAVVQNVGTLVGNGKINYMMGTGISVGNEMGGRMVYVFPEITTDLVDVQLFHKADAATEEAFKEQLMAYRDDLAGRVQPCLFRHRGQGCRREQHDYRA